MRGKIVDFLPISGSRGRLTIDIEGDFRATYDKLKGGDVNVDVSKWREKRSLDANAYAWVLLYKIAKAVREEPTVTYRKLIRNFPVKTKVCCCKEEDVESEVREFVAGHIGRMVDVGESKFPGYVVLHKKYGSSSFDTAQMSAFLDKIKEQCEELDIDTKPDEYVNSLLKEWN